MNLLRKWGKKLLISGIVSVAIDLLLRMAGLSFLSDLGGTYINVSLILVGAAGMYLENNMNIKIDTNDKQLSLLIAQAVAEEKKLKKIENWDINIIQDYVKQTLEGNKFIIWIQEKKIIVEKDFSINLIINFADRNELISSTQEIILKDGKKYQQNKHELAIKKEYTEKVFLCACNIIEEFFDKISKLEKININILLPDSYDSILQVFANREMFNKLINEKIVNSFDKLKFFQARYDFDAKNFDFKKLDS